MNPSGITLTKEQEAKLLFEIATYGESHIKKFVTFVEREKTMAKRKRLEGGRAGFELDGDKMITVPYITSLVSRTLSVRVKNVKNIKRGKKVKRTK